jgi:hypothetical protein
MGGQELERITNLHYPSAQMEARLYGLCLIINPPPVSSPVLEDPVPKIVDEAPPASMVSDVSKDIRAATSTRQPCPRAPVNRLAGLAW